MYSKNLKNYNYVNKLYKMIFRKADTYIIIYEFFSYRLFIVEDIYFNNILNRFGILAANGIMYISETVIHALEVFSLDYKTIGLPHKMKAPISICVIVTKYCNMNCRYCFSKGEKGLELDTEKTIARINENKDILSILITGGEPFSWDKLNDFIGSISDNISITIDTNGSLFLKSLNRNKKLEKNIHDKKIIIRMSLDSNIENIHNAVRGLYTDVIESIIYAIKKGMTVKINTVVHAANLDCLENLAKYLIDLGIKYWTIFRLNKGTAPSGLYISEEAEEKIISEIRRKYFGYLSISYIVQDKPFSHFFINTDGNYFTVNPANDEIRILGCIEKDNIYGAWQKMDKTSHISRYL